MTFNFSRVPACPSRARYFVRCGASTNFVRGFRNKAEVEEWFDEVRRDLDWRAGNLFRFRGDDRDLEIVTRKTWIKAGIEARASNAGEQQ